MRFKDKFFWWFMGVCTIPCVWLVASYIDVVLHNCDLNPVYQWWNLFAQSVGMV